MHTNRTTRLRPLAVAAASTFAIGLGTVGAAASARGIGDHADLTDVRRRRS